jgi:uncharacterized protein YjbI with pentapeptide repeats
LGAEFIEDSSLVGYDGGQNVKVEERRVAAETSPPPAPDHGDKSGKTEESSISVSLWLVVFALIVVGTVIEVLIFGYLERPGWIGVADKKFWDYLELLVVPAAVAVGVFLLDRSQRQREQASDRAQREREQQLEDQRRERELEVERQRGMDAAFQAYLDQMSHLLLEKELRTSQEESEARMLARARTLTVLARLDADRKGSVLRFLYEAGLISKEDPIVNLSGISILGSISGAADLSGVDLAFIYMGNVDLSGTLLTEADLAFCHLPGADLREADLSYATLTDADLSEADLRFTVLTETNLASAILSGANLEGVHLWANDLTEADLSNANLREADFAGSATGPLLSDNPDADFGDAILTDADLSGADLTDAIITEEQLAQCASLEGATMPNGKKYEEWLKDREGSGEAGQNDGA